MRAATSNQCTGIFIFFCLLAIFSLNHLSAQQTNNQPDSILRYTFDEVIITANRFENTLPNTGTTVSVLGIREIQSLPLFNTANILKYLPGLHTASGDGMGLHPLVTIRGFHGGGESEYMTVLVDGIPVNDPESGLANWNLLPINQISKIELLRGGSSALYGDAAMGGVLNLITQPNPQPFTRIAASYGSFGSLTTGVSHGGKISKGVYDLYAGYDFSDGFRENNRFSSFSFGGKLKYPVGNQSSITFQTANQVMSVMDPGALPGEIGKIDRKTSIPHYRADGKDNNILMMASDFRSKVNHQLDLNISLAFQHKNTNTKRTFTQSSLILSWPDFQPLGIYDTTLYGNTKKRDLSTDQWFFSGRIFNNDPDASVRFVGGIELDAGFFKNKVYDLFQGFESDYKNNFLSKDSLDFKGDGYRLKTAAYFNGEASLSSWLTLIAGIRYDMISDKFQSDFPVSDTSLNKTYFAFSPKISFNLTTGRNQHYEGSVFLGFSNAFKAPTLDQRTDLKKLNYAMFVQAGPAYQLLIINANPFSNAQLKPQRSTNLEAGTYQFIRISDRLSAEGNLALYLIYVRDEIDFDLQAFQYRNISSSRHTGIEGGLSLSYMEHVKGFVNLNLSEVRFDSGPNKDKTLKGVPSFYYHTGITYAAGKGIGGSLHFTGAEGIYLDDENTEKLKPYHTIDVRTSYQVKSLRIYVDIENLLDKQYFSAGYLSGSNSFLYPAAGRSVRAGLILTF